MIKKLLLTGLILLFCTEMVTAQSYQWITGGGSTESMSPSRNYERVTNMCTDEDGNVYITALTGATNILADTFYKALAYNTYSSIPHILLASYTCNGTMRWAKLIESSEEALTSYFGEDGGGGGLVYSNGSVYLVGSLSGDNKHIGYDTIITSTYLQSFTARYDTLGNFKWIRFIGTDTSTNELETGASGAVAVDGQGYIHNFNGVESGVQLMPLITSTTGTYDLKYDSSGNLISATKVLLDSIWTIQKAIFNKQNGKFYAMLQPDYSYWFTYYSSSISAVSAFLPDENMLWMDSTVEYSGLIGFDYKGQNEIYVAGSGFEHFSFGGLSVADTIFPLYNPAVVCRLDTNGVAQWIYNLQSNQGVDYFSDVTILPGEKIAATGLSCEIGIHGRDTITTPTSDYSALLLICDTGGNTITLNQTRGDGWDFGSVISSDTVGNIYIGGEDADSIGATGLTAYHSNGGNTDFFLLKYGVDCSCTSAPIASYTDTGTHTLGFTYTGTTTGIDSVVWSFGTGSTVTGPTATYTYTVAGIYNVCVTVYTECGSDEQCSAVTVTYGTTGISPAPARELSIFPNPASSAVTIVNAEDCRVQILNLIGQTVYCSDITSGLQTLNIGQLPPGIYMVQAEGKDGERWVQRLVVSAP